MCPGHVWLHCLHGWNYHNGAENKGSQGPRGPVMSESLPSYSCVRTLKDKRPLRQLRFWQLRVRGWLADGKPEFSLLVPAPGVSSTLSLWSRVWHVLFSAMSFSHALHAEQLPFPNQTHKDPRFAWLNSRESPTRLSQDKKNTDVTSGTQNWLVYPKSTQDEAHFPFIESIDISNSTSYTTSDLTSFTSSQSFPETPISSL